MNIFAPAIGSRLVLLKPAKIEIQLRDLATVFGFKYEEIEYEIFKVLKTFLSSLKNSGVEISECDESNISFFESELNSVLMKFGADSILIDDVTKMLLNCYDVFDIHNLFYADVSTFETYKHVVLTANSMRTYSWNPISHTVSNSVSVFIVLPKDAKMTVRRYSMYRDRSSRSNVALNIPKKCWPGHPTRSLMFSLFFTEMMDFDVDYADQ
jgi:hypothetical protein